MSVVTLNPSLALRVNSVKGPAYVGNGRIALRPYKLFFLKAKMRWDGGPRSVVATYKERTQRSASLHMVSASSSRKL